MERKPVSPALLWFGTSRANRACPGNESARGSAVLTGWRSVSTSNSIRHVSPARHVPERRREPAGHRLAGARYNGTRGSWYRAGRHPCNHQGPLVSQRQHAAYRLGRSGCVPASGPPVFKRSLGGDAALSACGGPGPEIVDRVMYGEDRWGDHSRGDEGRGSRARDRLGAAICKELAVSRGELDS